MLRIVVCQLLLVAVLLPEPQDRAAPPPPASSPISCTAGNCHASLEPTAHPHPPVEAGACVMCHRPASDEQHVFRLAREGGALCTSCHREIDPPGFALENFDPTGRWRDSYVSAGRGRARRGAAVDASYEMPDGRPFRDIEQFKSLVLEEKERLARNVAEKLLTYATGAPIQFADRPNVDQIVRQTAKSDFGFRSLLHAVATSETFLHK